MGNARRRPKRLAEKLLQIRTALGLSQPQIYSRLGVEEEITYHRISEFELDKSEPTLMVLLQYARVAGVHMEDLVDDELNLPEKLPGNYRHEGIRSKSSARRKPKR
jgi:transcriptional regulator with XRE-family HTH domain